MRKQRLSVDDVQGAWAIVPTPSKSNASDWRAQDTVDLDEAARVVEQLIAAGINGILSLGSLGECATLTWDEKRDFMRVLVEAARGRVPVFGGTSSLSTRESVRQTREAAELGVDGVMLGPPMWCAPDVPTAVQFYRDLAEACPDTAICVYANHEAFKFEFPRPFWAQVADIPQVICAKYLGIGALVPDLRLTRGRIRFFPIDVDYYAAARIDPESCTAFWTSGAVCGPQPVIALRDAVAAAKRSGDWTEAKRLGDAIGRTYQTLFPLGSFKEFSVYNIGLEKARMDAAGWMKAGPCRPPYTLVPEPYLEGARESGRRWAALHAELGQAAGTASAQGRSP
ncbi:dihydrodipicolinate synthase family protein [Panacagrimonas sp.]|uniref:dihydrodipicolinate synthase family protein n=1 Tax=Panacagrimonas sp. TaxID=2480088 RepID=UPI003B51E6A7